MNKKLKKVVSLVFTGILTIGALTGCGNSGETTSAKKESKGTVKMGYVNWVDSIAMSNLVKVVLEEKMGYEVEMKQGEAGMVFTSIASGDMDLYADAWLPTTHKDYIEEYKSDLEILNSNYENARIGLAVPAYMKDINSIGDLNKVKDEINREIIGIEPGAGQMEITEDAIKEYGLDIELREGSEATMLAMLKKAYDKEEPIVIAAWSPHWKFSRWDLRFLEDPKKIFGEAENIHTVTRKGFSEDMPEVAEFLKNFKLNDDQLGGIMLEMQDSDKDPKDIAREWVKENEEVVNSWIPKE